jgi:hypothetical protein
LQAPIRLNVFQRLVRNWDTVHPYNAAQIIHIDGAPDSEKIRDAWQATLAAMGLGPVHVEGHDYHFESVNGSASLYRLAMLDPDASLDQFVSEQMNQPFAEGELPLRPFIQPQNGSFYLGIVYQHWVADSASIQMLMREWFVRMYDPSSAQDRPARAAPGGYWRIFGPHRSRWRIGEQVLTLLRSYSRFRRVRKLRTLGSSDFAMHFSLHRAPEGLLPKLQHIAKEQNVTLNDLFLAAMATVCDRFNPVRNIPRRRDLALGMIVDLRRRTRRDMSRVFGLFLGFANVVCRPSDIEHWPRLVRRIAQQTRAHKQNDSPQASTMWMLAALITSRYVPAEQSFKLYRKHMPLAGGISNVNMNHAWAAQYHPSPLLEYIRVSPTGPMVPLVFSTTTLGKEMVLGLTYRSALFSDELARSIAKNFLSLLSEWAQCEQVV